MSLTLRALVLVHPKEVERLEGRVDHPQPEEERDHQRDLERQKPPAELVVEVDENTQSDRVDQGQVEAQIAELEDKASRAQIIDPSTLSGDKVIFGATVTLLDEDDKPIKYQIVGETEADAAKGRISYSSPIARAMIGKQVNDEIEVTVPSGDKFYLVEKVEFI